jgi:hypothetical protein
MMDFKKKLEVRLNGNEIEINELIIKLKNDAKKKIENFVDSQNSKFKGIKAQKQEYDNIYENFKEIYHNEEDFQKE